MIKSNAERVLSDLYMLREIGRYKTGVHRPTLTDDDMKTRYWLKDALAALGHEAFIDGIANVIGYSPATGRKLLCGSHLETQNRAGWLDGALGVVYALEAARALSDAGVTDVGIDVMAFADEEGHFGNLIGSNSLVGNVSEADMDGYRDRTSGTPLREALARVGLAGVPRATLDPSRYVGMFEAHIEQGESLETEGLSIGVVTSIVGNWHYRVTAHGIQNHAGTTRMAIRKDAGAALMRIYHEIDKGFPRIAQPRTVWTVGKITLDPGAPSIVPGRAELVFQFRDADLAMMERLHEELAAIVLEEHAIGPCDVELTVTARSMPAQMDEGLLVSIDAAAEALAPGKYVRMPSGAGHDARTISEKVPSAMIFIPSINGISHHYTENTSDEDIALGAQVFVDAAWRMLQA